METSQTPVIPSRQAMVRIAGYEVLAICTADGNVAAGVRMICGLLGIHYLRQMRKLQTDPDFRDCLILAKIEIAGQQRVVWFIIAEFIPLWLKGIHPSKVAPEARETLEEIRSVAVQALRAFFFPETREQPQAAPPKEAPKQVPPSSPQATPVASSVPELLRALAGNALALADTALTLAARVEQDGVKQEQRLGLLEHQQAQDVAWMADAHHQMQLQREATEVLWSVVLGSASAPEEALSADQQHTLQLLLRYHQQATGQPARATEREVLSLVGAAGLSHLRQEDWKPILAWFRQRLGW